MKIKKVPIKDLVSPEWNPRQITDEELEKLKKSIKEFGYIDPIIVNEYNNHIVGGNQRYLALKQLGYEEVDVIFINEPNIMKEKAMNIALNKISGDWDQQKLEVILEEIELSDIDVKLTGFEEIELTPLNNEEEYEFNDDNEIKEYTLEKELFKLIITFESEKEQQDHYEKFISEGLECRILTL